MNPVDACKTRTKTFHGSSTPDDDAPAKPFALSYLLFTKRIQLMPPAARLVPDYTVVHVNSAHKYVVTISLFGHRSKERTLPSSQ